MDGRFYHFKPIPNADAKEQLQVDFIYRRHPVIMISQYGRKGKVWVVTPTSHPHFDNQPADNFLPIHSTPSSTSGDDKPLTMKLPNLMLPKNSWVVINSHCRVPKDALREMKQGDVQYALDEGSLKTLRASIARAVTSRSWKGEATEAKQGKKTSKAESALKAAEKSSAVEEQATNALVWFKQSISALEVRLACLESLYQRLDIRS